MNRLTTVTFLTRHYYTDRFFSQVIRHFLSFFAALHLGKPHVHWPYPEPFEADFRYLFETHLILDGEAPYEVCHKGFSLPDQTYAKYFSITDLFSETNMNLLRTAYRYKTHTPTFDPLQFTVAAHIRRGDIASTPYMDRYTHLDFFVNLLEQLYTRYPCIVIHIYSDSPLPTLSFPLVDHSSDALLPSVHDMICADVLLISMGSNVSHFAGLLSQGLVFFDKRKLEPCFNNQYNIYWGKHPSFVSDEAVFLQKLDTLVKNDRV